MRQNAVCIINFFKLLHGGGPHAKLVKEFCFSMICVYKVTSPSKKIYVGSTINYKKRIMAYRRLDCKVQTKLYNSLKKYGFDAHLFEVVEECDISIVRMRESHWGCMFDVLGANGLNLALPKSTQNYSTCSESTRAKISAVHKGKILSAEQRALISERNKGKFGSLNPVYGKKRPDFAKMSSEYDRTGRRNGMYGRTHTDEVKQRLREMRLGKPNPHKCKEIVCTKTGQKWGSAKELSRAVNIKYSTLVSQLNGSNTNKTTFRYAC